MTDKVSNNTVIYSGAGAAIGAGAGIAAGYLSKPYQKNGELKDSFIKKAMTKISSEKERKKIIETQKLPQIIDRAKNADEVKKILEKYDYVFLDGDIQAETLFRLDVSTLKRAKRYLKNSIITLLGDKFDDVRDDFNQIWDKQTKKFVYNSNAMSENEFKGVQKFARRIQGLHAAIYGAVGAIILGASGFLYANHTKNTKTKPEEPAAAQQTANIAKTSTATNATTNLLAAKIK